MSFSAGNSKDGKHYWLTPPDLYNRLNEEFNFDFDPCPYPLPEGFDGLAIDWGNSNYVNPPFGGYLDERGKKRGPTIWARKAIMEYRKGRSVVLVYPLPKWVLMLIENSIEIRNLGDVKWHSTEDNLPGKGTGAHVAAFIMRDGSMVENKQQMKLFDI